MATLETPIELRDSQSGFAGKSGTIWRVGVDGRYVVRTFVNEKLGPPIRQGQLDRSALQAIAAAIGALRQQAFPPRLSSIDVVNPRELSVADGDHRVVLQLAPPDPADPDAVEGLDPRQREFLRLFRGIRDLISTRTSA